MIDPYLLQHFSGQLRNMKTVYVLHRIRKVFLSKKQHVTRQIKSMFVIFGKRIFYNRFTLILIKYHPDSFVLIFQPYFPVLVIYAHLHLPEVLLF